MGKATSLKLNTELCYDLDESNSVEEYNEKAIGTQFSNNSKLKYQIKTSFDKTTFIIDESDSVWNHDNPEIVLRTKITGFCDIEQILLAKNAIERFCNSKNKTPKIVLYIEYLFGNGFEFNSGDNASNEIEVIVKLLSAQNFYKIFIYEPYDIDYLNKCVGVDFNIHPEKRWRKTSMIHDFEDVLGQYNDKVGVVFANKKMYDEYMPIVKMMINCECTYPNYMQEHAILEKTFSNEIKQFVIIDSGIYSGATAYKIIKALQKEYSASNKIDLIIAHFPVIRKNKYCSYINESINKIYISDSHYTNNGYHVLINPLYIKTKIIKSKY